MLVLPQNIIKDLHLRKIRDAWVGYANNSREQKTVYGVVNLNLKGRIGNFDVLAETAGTEPLIGQIVIEELDRSEFSNIDTQSSIS